MGAEYPSAITVEVELDGVDAGWTDISDDVLPPVHGTYGILGNGPTDRVAGTGTMTFTLNNSVSNSGGLAGYYSPGHTNCLSGFEAGIGVRLGVTYDGKTRYKI